MSMDSKILMGYIPTHRRQASENKVLTDTFGGRQGEGREFLQSVVYKNSLDLG